MADEQVERVYEGDEPSAEPDVLPNPPQPFWTDRFRAWFSRTFDPKHESWM